MRGHRPKVFHAAVAIGAVAAVFATATVAAATPASIAGCAQLEALKAAFPQARAIGFARRTAIRPGGVPLWAGICATWSTSYRRGRAAVDVSLTLFGSPEQADVAHREVRTGWKQLASGAFVHTSDRGLGLVSVYRDVLIESRSTAGLRVPLPTQMRLHRQMHARVGALEQPANLRPPWWIF